MEYGGVDFIAVARQLSTSGCYSKAFDFYMFAFEKNPHVKLLYELEFRSLMSRLIDELHAADNQVELYTTYTRALVAFPDNVFICNAMGKFLYKCRFYQTAWYHFEKATRMDSTFVEAEKNFNSLKNLLVERWHLRMLNDKIRNEAYRAAIHETVVPQKDRVLDVGTGTGLLTLYASECKPAAITACDGSEVMTELATKIIQENGCKNCVILNQMSTQMQSEVIGGLCSLLITEMFDAGLFGEHILQSLLSAWEQLINPDGRVLPGKAEFFVIGAECDFLYRKLQLCPSIKSTLKISALNVHVLTFDEPYDSEDVHLFGDDIKYITEPKSLMKVDFNDYDGMNSLIAQDQYEVALPVLESGEMNTVIGYFNLYLTDNITITTDPRSENRCNAWQQAIFFDKIPVQVKKNDLVPLSFSLNGGKLTLQKDEHITRISSETLRFLNDSEYINMIGGCIGMASVYLGQMAEMSEITIIDLCPFPMFGLQLLRRGARSLVCTARTDSDKLFFEEVFAANEVPLSSITILVGEDWSQDGFGDDKYHAVFYNILEMGGEIDLRLQEMAQHLKQHHLVRGGLVMPANINIMGQIVYSNWLDINNRLFDENVSNYSISKHLKKYHVSQNFCIDFTHLEYTPLSDPCVIGTSANPTGTVIIELPITKEGCPTALLCWYTIELMKDMNEISTNRKNSYIDGTVYLIHPDTRYPVGEIIRIKRCVDPDGAFKFSMLKILD